MYCLLQSNLVNEVELYIGHFFYSFQTQIETCEISLQTTHEIKFIYQYRRSK